MAPVLFELGRIVQANVPVLCLDTCSLLDVIRDPFRDASQPHDARAAVALLQALKAGSRLIGLLADQVQVELDSHLANVVDEAQRGLRKLRVHVTRVDGLVSAFGAAVNTDLSPWNHHVANASNAVQQWIAASAVAPQSAAVPNRAYSRAMRVQAPARKGKDSLQDCVVLETYLEVVGALRQGGLTATVVFLSSNTNDYSESPTKKAQLHPGLVQEFAALNMQFANGHGMARALLGL
jgi:hypothetical protein